MGCKHLFSNVAVLVISRERVVIGFRESWYVVNLLCGVNQMKHISEVLEPILVDIINFKLAEVAEQEQVVRVESEASEELDLIHWMQNPRNFGPDYD